MDKMKRALLTMMMAVQIGTVGGQSPMMAANGLGVLTQIAHEQDWQMDGIVCEAWLSEPSVSSVKWLMRLLGLESASLGGEFALTEQSTVKIRYDEQDLIVQMISTSEDEAAYYYQQLNQWSALFGKKTPIGATILCQREPLTQQQCQQLLAKSVEALPVQFISSMQDGSIQSSAYHLPGVYPSLKVAGQWVNLNVACVRGKDQTSIYLGSPVIYQQY